MLRLGWRPAASCLSLPLAQLGGVQARKLVEPPLAGCEENNQRHSRRKRRRERTQLDLRRSQVRIGAITVTLK